MACSSPPRWLLWPIAATQDTNSFVVFPAQHQSADDIGPIREKCPTSNAMDSTHCRHCGSVHLDVWLLSVPWLLLPSIGNFSASTGTATGVGSHHTIFTARISPTLGSAASAQVGESRRQHHRLTAASAPARPISSPSNNKGMKNGWCNIEHIYGRVIEVLDVILPYGLHQPDVFCK